MNIQYVFCGLEGKDDEQRIHQINSNRMLAFFVDFEENQLLDGDGCNCELPVITELRLDLQNKRI